MGPWPNAGTLCPYQLTVDSGARRTSPLPPPCTLRTRLHSDVSVQIVSMYTLPAAHTQQGLRYILLPTLLLIMSLTKKDLKDLVKGYKVDLANINTKLDTLLSENAALKKLVAARDEEIEGLKLHVNELEQHNRLWSVRILGLPLTPAEEKSSLLVRDKVFSNIIRPIIEGAVSEGDLQQVPLKANDIIEMAHPL
jgi:hypothetical protein